MSRHHRNIDPTNAQIHVLRTVAKTLTVADSAKCVVMNHLVERTGEAVILLSNYISYRIDLMLDGVDGNSPFVMKLRNRSNTVIRACDDFAKVLEPYIEGEMKKKAYMFFSDAVQNALDSLFDDMHRDEPEATAQIRRRAKLRYHDPYPTDIKERTEAFEDGYTKGYTDAMDDFMRELAALGETDQKLVVDVTDRKVNIKKLT